MLTRLKKLRYSLISRLIFAVGMALLLTISAWAFFNIKYQKQKLMDNILSATDKLTNTITLGTRYAMMRNSRHDLNQIINNIAKQQGFKTIRIYNKKGQIKFSNEPSEIDSTTDIRSEACQACHQTDPPRSTLDINARTRIYNSGGVRLLGIVSPISNFSGCASNKCHAHSQKTSVLGILEIIVSLENTDSQIAKAEKDAIGLACFAFLFTSTIICVFILKFVNRPIKDLISGTRRIAKGQYDEKVALKHPDEIGQLAAAVNTMGNEIADKQAELNRQRDEYQNLFEHVPCLITVQDRHYKLIKYNREFSNMFDPEPNSYCYTAYKGRTEKCVYCAVERTFKDGKPHYSEETGFNKDGTVTHWISRTSPIKNAEGEIVAAMEISLDITPSKELEEKLELSENKYQAIFNNIPNPVFVLDFDSLDIIDCNQMVTEIYGYTQNEIIKKPFKDFFEEEDKKGQISDIKSATVINQAKHLTKEGEIIYVDIWLSPTEYYGEKVLLVTTNDITKRLETEQQLIQASKMATLGEMATGVAHELNQPLSVIKTVSSFFIKKIRKKEKIEEDTLSSMLSKVDSNVDRASKIINHMREFARKSEIDLERVQVKEVLEKTFEIFSQQLKVRGIELLWEVGDNLPEIMADPGRLEQVFVNLLVNARDAIEKKWEVDGSKSEDDRITIKTTEKRRSIVVEVTDTGVGIPSSITDKIFEPFFTTKEVGKGTGLGLSISYGIIKECGGHLEVAPLSNGGACFTITLPIADS